MSKQLHQAEACYQTGEFGKAEAFCRSLLQLEPNHPQATYLLGLIAAEAGQDQAAMALIGQAIELEPTQSDRYVALAELMQRNGHGQTALQLMGLAHQHCPKNAALWLAQGDLLARLDQNPAAEQAYAQALSLEVSALAFYHLSLLQAREGRLSEAATTCAQALEHDANDPAIWLHAGQLAFDQGEREAARKAWLQALILAPASAAVYRALGALMADPEDAAQLHQALAGLEQVPHARLALCFFLLKHHLASDQTDQALAYGEQGLAIEDNPLLHEALADVRRQRGEVVKALEHLQQAESLYLASAPDSPRLASLVSRQVFLQLMLPQMNDQAQAERQQDWNRRFGQTDTALPPPVSPDPGQAGRRLRVGYVSGDFCQRSAVLMHQLLFAHHDPQQVEITCYANVLTPDDTTRRMQAQIPRWRDIAGLSDAQAARLIRQDHIDILVDLNGHSDGNRLGVFARRPAPVQVSGLGFGFPTGLRAFTAHLTDAVLVPDECAAIYGERLLKLSQVLHWQTSASDLPLSPLPLLSTGDVTFASGNGLYKITDQVIAVWAKILNGCEGSRLLLKTPELTDPGIRAALQERFSARGIGPERLEMLGRTSHQAQLEWYARADLVLDSFPYQGGFSCCEPLWMGVPVITRRGGTRGADSVLTAIGRQEWIAEDAEAYIAKACALASDTEALMQARQTLREQLQASAVMDAATLAREVEAHYRTLWQEYCESGSD